MWGCLWLVMIGIGAMMGPGIFALPSEVAGSAGPLGILAYLFMGGLTLFTAFSYSELGAAIPIAGGGYSFTSRTLPRPVAFLTGWFFWIGNTLACSLYAVIFALTIKVYFFPEVSVIAVVVATTLVFTASNFVGQASALKFITVMNIIELIILIGVGILGAFQVEPANLEPFAPMGLGPLLPTMGLIYISYVGFDLITVAAEEIKDPAKNIPRAIFITLGTGIAIYVLLLWVMMGVVNYTDLAETSTPLFLSQIICLVRGADGRESWQQSWRVYLPLVSHWEQAPGFCLRWVGMAISPLSLQNFTKNTKRPIFHCSFVPAWWPY